MQTIAIDIEKMQNPKEIADVLEREAVQPGDKVLVLADKQMLALYLVSFLVIIWLALNYITQKKEAGMPNQASNDAEEPGISAEKIINEFETPEAVEEAIENKFGISIEFAPKTEKLYDPIEAAFGMWQDRDMTLDKIRSEAWQRTK
ncbi:MAG: hypothetical protein ACK4TA_16480 [Saprospiraceae bacterium]